MARLPRNTRILKNGKYERRFYWSGSRYSVYGSNISELNEKERAKIQELENNKYLTSENITLEQLIIEFLREKEKTIKCARLYQYKLYFSRLPKKLLKTKVCDIEKRQIIEFLESNKKIYNLMLQYIKPLFEYAYKMDITPKNITIGITKVKKTTPKARDTIHRALTLEEQKNFFNQLKKDNSYYYNLLAFMVSTGVRFGEACALTWADIDYKNNVININKTITRDLNGACIVGNSAKTESGLRDIPLTDSVKKILFEQKKQNFLFFGNTNLIFPSKQSRKSLEEIPINHSTVSGCIERTVKKINENGYHMERINTHALRDTFATRYIEQGGTPNTLKTILGHSNLSMTMDLYAHVLPNTKQEEMNKINIII